MLLVVAAMLLWRARQSRFGHEQDARIAFAADRYQVDPALVKAVVWQESRFDPGAVGKAGEIGLMQLTDPAAQEWAEAEEVYPVPESHLFDPMTNVMAGTWYLGKMLRRYERTDDPVAFALADYNAGRANVLKWAQGPAETNGAAFVARIGFVGTSNYVRSIKQRREKYVLDF